MPPPDQNGCTPMRKIFRAKQIAKRLHGSLACVMNSPASLEALTDPPSLLRWPFGSRCAVLGRCWVKEAFVIIYYVMVVLLESVVSFLAYTSRDGYPHRVPIP